MNRKNRKTRSSWIDVTFSISIIALTIAAIYLITLSTQDKSTSQAPKKNNSTQPPIVVDSVDSNFPGIKLITETSNDPNAPYAIQYPQSLHTSFNEEINTYIQYAKQKYLFAMSNTNQKDTPLSGELNISFETLHSHSGYYSFVLVNSSSVGDAHGVTEIRSFHLNPESGKMLSIQDLFGGNNHYLQKASEITSNKLKIDPALKDSMTNEDVQKITTSTWDNFNNFAITDESIIFYFSQYEASSGIVGPPIVAIPLEEINMYLSYEFKMKVQEDVATKLPEENIPVEEVSPPSNVKDDSQSESDGTDDTQQKKVALTFDDGPDPKVTTQILGSLKKYDAKATFFMLGSRVEYYPEITKNVADAGHELGNHTWTHADLTKANVTKIQKEINKTSAIIEEVTGRKATEFRPPYGAVNKTVREQTNLPVALWTVDTLDWKYRDSAKLLECVKNSTKDGSIILMHDIHQSTADGLDAVLAYLQSEGYTFVTVSELN